MKSWSPKSTLGANNARKIVDRKFRALQSPICKRVVVWEGTCGIFAIQKIQRLYFFKYCTMYMVYLSGLLLIIYCILRVSGVGREQLLTPAASNFLMLLRPQFVIHQLPVHNCSIFLSTGNMNDREYQCDIIFHRTANLIISIKKNIASCVSVRIW